MKTIIQATCCNYWIPI